MSRGPGPAGAAVERAVGMLLQPGRTAARILPHRPPTLERPSIQTQRKRTFRLNVLIVDDNVSAAELLQELIVLQDHQARCAHTAQEAIDAFSQDSYDVALVDLTLPDRPGTEVAQHLRSNAGDRPLLLVAISGYGAGDATGAQAVPYFDHYLQKPIDFDALDRLLARPASA